MKVYYYTDAWYEIGAIIGKPYITHRNNMYGSCTVSIRDFEGALYDTWKDRDFTKIIVAQSYSDPDFTNILFQGYLVGKKFSANALILNIAGFGIMMDWVSFEANYILEQGKIKDAPIPATATLEMYDDLDENNSYDVGELFTWTVDEWHLGSRDVGLLIVDNTTSIQSQTWTCTGVTEANEDSHSGDETDVNIRDDNNRVVRETGTGYVKTLDASSMLVMGGVVIADSNYLQKIEIDIKFGLKYIHEAGNNCTTNGHIDLKTTYEAGWSDSKVSVDHYYYTPNGGTVEKWFNGKVTILGTNAELAKYLGKVGANYETQVINLVWGLTNFLGIQSLSGSSVDGTQRDCDILVDFAEVTIYYTTQDIAPIMETITDNAASTLTCDGVTWDETGVATNDIFYIGENTSQILSDVDGFLPDMEIEVLSTLSKYMARHFKAVQCLDVVRAICHLEGCIWCEDHEYRRIKIIKPADFVDSGIDLDSTDYDWDWEYEDKCNQVKQVDVWGNASYNIHGIARDDSVSGNLCKNIVDDTIMTNADAQTIADTQLALLKTKRPSIKLTLDGYNTDIKMGTYVGVTLARPTIAATDYPIRMIERGVKGISGIKTIIHVGLGESTADEEVGNAIRNIGIMARKNLSNKLVGTPWSAGASISYGDIAGFGTGVRDIIDLEVGAGESIDNAIDALIAAHHDAASADHDDRYYTETEIDAYNFLQNIVEDVTPQLGADLDVVNYDIERLGCIYHADHTEWLLRISSDGYDTGSLYNIGLQWDSTGGVKALKVSGYTNLYLGVHANTALAILNATNLTMAVPIAMGTNRITGLGDSVDAQDAATRQDVLDATIAANTLDQAFDWGKIIDGANSEANAFGVGDGADYLKIYGLGGIPFIKAIGGNYPAIQSDGGAYHGIYTGYEDATHYAWFGWDIANNEGIINVVGGALSLRVSGDWDDYIKFSTVAGVPTISVVGETYAHHDYDLMTEGVYPDASNSWGLGHTSAVWNTVYYHALSDRTCADFSNYSMDGLYNLFKAFKPRTDGILHKSHDAKLYFKHIDMSSIPDEFAMISDVDHEVPRMPKLKKDISLSKTSFTEEDIESELVSINYKKGDKCGIDFGEMTYALKDLVIKQYEFIKNLENRIKILEGVKI